LAHSRKKISYWGPICDKPAGDSRVTENPLIISMEDGVKVLTMNRPAKKNAITVEMYKQLADALGSAEADPKVRAILITGAGDCFTAGNDLGDFAAVAAGGERAPHAMRFIQALGAAQKPLVAAVVGLAVGVGVTMLLHCDLTFVAQDAKLSVPFVNLAVVPEAASSLLLQQRIGYARAFEMFALGEPMLGDRAAAIGLVNAALPAGEVFPAALAAAKALAQRPLGALKATKGLMRDAELIKSVIEKEGGIFHARLVSAEAAEAFRAFAERRAPDFSKFAEEA